MKNIYVFLFGVLLFFLYSNGLSAFDSKSYQERIENDYQNMVESGDPILGIESFSDYKDNLKSVAEIVGADSNSIEELKNPYYKDEQSIYNILLRGKIDNVDYDSFAVIEGSRTYAKDQDNIYYNGTIVSDADVQSFTPYEDYDNIGFDNQNYFFGNKKVLSKGKVSKVLSEYCFLVSDLFIRCYANSLGDVEEVYTGKVTGELMSLSENLYKDNVYVYNFGYINNFELTDDVNNFEVLNNMYMKDSSKVYYYKYSTSRDIDEVESVDANSFQVYKTGEEEGYEFATDNNQVFLYGISDDRYNREDFTIESALSQRNEIIEGYQKEAKNVIVYGVIYQLLLSFLVLYICFNLISRNQKLGMSIKEELIAVVIGVIGMNILGYFTNKYLSNISNALDFILPSLIGGFTIMIVTKFIFKKDINLLKDSLKLGAAAILLSIMLGFIITLVLAGTFLGAYIR